MARVSSEDFIQGLLKQRQLDVTDVASNYSEVTDFQRTL
jgi:hypothetical protein